MIAILTVNHEAFEGRISVETECRNWRAVGGGSGARPSQLWHGNWEGSRAQVMGQSMKILLLNSHNTIPLVDALFLMLSDVWHALIALKALLAEELALRASW